jgi:hypothetical protein
MLKLIKESNKDVFNFYDLKNADALRDEFVDMLMNFDKRLNEYQTDVYLYVNEDGTGELYEFTNVGGNSWLDDDHYTLYSDKQHYEDVLDWYQDEYEIAEALGKTEDELKEEALVALDLQDDYWIDEIGYKEVKEYVETNEEYMDILYDVYDDAIDDMWSDYEEKADAIIDYFNQMERETY